MQATKIEPGSSSNQAIPVPRADLVRRLIDQAGNLLPSQGPITAFVFLNTLQALENMPFDEGLKKGARLFGCHPYLSEARYREKMERGRILTEDLTAVLKEDMGHGAIHKIGGLGTRLELRHAMLQYPLRFGPAEELRWFVAETDALSRMRSEASTELREKFIEETKHWVMRDLRDGNSNGNGNANGKSHEHEKGHPEPEKRFKPITRRGKHLLADILERFGEASIEQWSPATWEALSLQALWRVCREGVHNLDLPRHETITPIRHRDRLFAECGEDTDALVHPVLIRFSAAFCDQGFADWPLPCRELGFFQAFHTVYGHAGGPPDHWMAGLTKELDRLRVAGLGPMESLLESLELLGVEDNELEDYMTATLLALRGWAGLMRQMEVRPDRVATPVPTGTVIEYVAVRLILERLALAHVARSNLGYKGDLAHLKKSFPAEKAHEDLTSVEQRAFYVFQLAQVRGWSPATLHRLTKREWTNLLGEIESFSVLERRRLFHQAFERRYRLQAVNAIYVHTRSELRRIEKPRFQAVFCIDTREESFRRHLEEIEPNAETFGAAGFFGVPIYYRGVADAHFSTLCPIVLRPQHWVVEDVVYTLEEQNRRRAKTRKAIGTASHQVHLGSRSIAQGALLAAGFGVLASIPLVARVLFPRLTANIRRSVGSFVAPPQVTRLRMERSTPNAGPADDQIGFTVPEMANMAERMLRDIGLTQNFARLVMFFGHGSFCLNNPHKSAYDCGACSGAAGSPNARALALMLNDSRIREILEERNIHIPRDTLFLGGLHNTCADAITFLDLDLLPKSHQVDFEHAREILEKTCDRNAHERCRRFQSAPLNQSLAAARRHVEERSQDLAQTRPEFGNASNAMCFVGRRGMIRGLYMDRRCFLHSYDPTTDDAECTILGRILGAVVPVCSGINLQYFFSYIDSPGWGCGTKLPHNVTSLLGVMDGAASDLRPGLPWQGVEIHEPIRLLIVIESTAEGMRKIMSRSETVRNILRNGWVQLALRHPETSQMSIYRNDEFEPFTPDETPLPKVASSIDWYRGWRDHLGFAEVDSTTS